MSYGLYNAPPSEHRHGRQTIFFWVCEVAWGLIGHVARAHTACPMLLRVLRECRGFQGMQEGFRALPRMHTCGARSSF